MITTDEQVAEEFCDDFPLFLYEGDANIKIQKGVKFPDVFCNGVADNYIQEGSILRIVETRDFHLTGNPEVNGASLRTWTKTLERWLEKDTKIEYLMTGNLNQEGWTSRFFKSLQRNYPLDFRLYDLKNGDLNEETSKLINTWQRHPFLLIDDPPSLWVSRGYDGSNRTAKGLVGITMPASEDVGLIDVLKARFDHVVEKYGNKLSG